MSREVPLYGKGSKALSPSANACRTVNWFPHIVESGNVVLYPSHGLKPWAQVGDGPIRGQYTMNGVDYVVSGPSLWSITNTDFQETTNKPGDIRLLGNVEPGPDPVTIIGNGSQIAVLSNQKVDVLQVVATDFYAAGQIVRVTTTSDNFPVRGLAYLNGYGILIADGARWFITALYDFTSIDPLDFATAESLPDNLLACIASNGEIYLIGGKSTEAWYPTGDTGGEDDDEFPFARRNGLSIPHGINSPQTLIDTSAGLMWLDDERRVVLMRGYVPVPVNSDALNYELARAGQVRDGRAVRYVQDGHEFYCLTFQGELPVAQTWCYDIGLKFWHQRSTDGGAWWPSSFVNFGSNWIAGGTSGNKLLRADNETFSDAGIPHLRSHVFPELRSGTDRIQHWGFEVRVEAGVGLNDGQGNDPQLWLDWSDDGGKTWGNQISQSLGKIGEYLKRCLWRKLGMSRGRYYRVNCSDPVKAVLISAVLNPDG